MGMQRLWQTSLFILCLSAFLFRCPQECLAAAHWPTDTHSPVPERVTSTVPDQEYVPCHAPSSHSHPTQRKCSACKSDSTLHSSIAPASGKRLSSPIAWLQFPSSLSLPFVVASLRDQHRCCDLLSLSFTSYLRSSALRL